MLKEAEIEKPGYTLYNFLQDKFSRVSPQTASSMCEAIKVTSRTKVADIDHAQAEVLFKVFSDSKLPPPPTDCLAPIGVRQILAGLLKSTKAEFYAASSREAAVYRGRPFLIEAAVAFGGELKADEPARVIRFANRVPLLFQQSACSSFKAVAETNWRNYDLQQPRGSVPTAPMVIMIHMASVWVPFTSESKEAIADYDEIRKEMKLALMECGRKLGAYLRKRLRMRREGERRDIFERYIGEIANAIHAINKADAKRIYEALLEQARKRTAIADAQLDEEGKFVKDEEDLTNDAGVIVLNNAVPAEKPDAKVKGALDDAPALKQSRAEAAKLKVAAMRDEDEPLLLAKTDQPSARADKPSRRGEEPSKKTKPGQANKPAAKEPAKPAAPSAKPAAPPAAQPTPENARIRVQAKPAGGLFG